MAHSLALCSRRNLSTVKENLRLKIPRLNEKQLERLRMPFHEGLANELQDLNFKKAFEVFKKVLTKNKFESIESQKLLQKVFESLKKIPGKSTEEEIEIFLDLIKDIWNVPTEFDWLIELLLVHSTELIEEYNLNNKKIDAIVKFIHATALSERFQWYRPAVVLLESAFQLTSINKEWTFQSERLCVLISHQLSTCLSKLSRQVREDEKDIEGALMLSKRSLKVLRKYLSEKSMGFEMEGEFEYAACYFDKKSFEDALNHYGHALTLSEALKNKRRSCEILVKIGECYKCLNDIEKFEHYLNFAKELSQELKELNFEGEIHLKLGEYFSQIDNYEKTTIYLNAAIKCFNKSKNFTKLGDANLILAKVKAKNTFNALIDTILRSDKSKMGHNRDYDKLVLWIDRKFPLTNRYHEFYRIDDDPCDVKDFIKKYYDPDEIIKIQ